MADKNPSSAPTEDKCSLWLPKKKRYCRFPRVLGFEYCGHHLSSRGEEGADRIPCPLDPSHSIFAKDLDRHLSVCPRAQEAATMSKLPCYRHNVNAGLPDGPPPLLKEATGVTMPAVGTAIHGSLIAARQESFLSGVSVERLVSFIAKLRRAHAQAGSPVLDAGSAAEDGAMASPLVASLLTKEGTTGAKANKHRAQNLEIARALELQGLLRSGAIHIELGAGKGLLSAVVSEAT